MSVLKNFLDFAGLSTYDNKIKQIINSKVAKIKMNNNTLTPDSSGEINLGNIATTSVASDSADGLMSKEDYTRLKNVAAGAEVNVQSDWNESNTSSDAFIKNKPSLGTASAKNYTTSVTSGSSDLVTSGGVYNAIDEVESVAETLIKDTVGWSGKNRLDNTGWEKANVHGILFTPRDDGTILINGQNDGTSQSVYWIMPTPHTPQEQEILSGLPEQFSDVNWGGANIGYAISDVVLSVNNSYTIALVVDVGASVDNVVVRPMIRSASILDPTFEPYHPTVDETKADKLPDSTSGDIASLDTSGNLADSGISMFGDKTYDFADILEVKNALPVPAKSYAVKVKAKQDLHGLPFPYVGGAYKNKLPMTVARIKAANIDGTWTGNVYTINDATFEILIDNADNVTGIKINGTPSSEVRFSLHGFGNGAVFSENAIMTGCPSGGSNNSYKLYISNNITSDANDTGNGVSLSPELFNSAIYNSLFTWIVISANYTATNLIFYPMIRLATESDATFAPYSNICPIIGWDKVKPRIKSADIWNDGDVLNKTQSFHVNTTLAPGKYTMSALVTSTDIDAPTSRVIFMYEDDLTGDNSPTIYFGRGQIEEHDVTISKNVVGVYFYAGINYLLSTADVFSFTNLSLREVLITPEVNFPHTVYDGEFDSDGNLRDDDGIVTDDSIFNISTATSSGGMYWSEVPVSANAKIGGNAISSHLPYVSDGNIAWIMQEPCFTINADSGIRIYIDESTVEGVKARLANLQVAYELATSTTTSITAPDIPLFKGDNVISADSGQMKMIVGGMADAFESKADKVTNATSGHLAGLDANGNLIDSGVSPTEEVTVEGNPVTFDSPFEQDAKSVVVSVKPIQDLHGYDAPWVGGAGKNKIDISLYDSNYFSRNNETLSNIQIDSKNTLDLVLRSYSGESILDEYYLTVSETGRFALLVPISSGVTSIYLKHDGATKDLSILREPWTAPGTFTLSLTVEGYDPSTVGGVVISDIQIESGSTATSFAPYSNICPISGRDKVEIPVTGKNRLPLTLSAIKSANTDGTWSGNSYTYRNVVWDIQADNDGIITEINANGTANASSFLYLYYPTAGERLTQDMVLNGCPVGGDDATKYILAAWQDGGNMEADEGEGVTVSSGFTLNCVYAVVRQGFNAQNLAFYPMLRKADIADPTFEPYNPNSHTTTIPLPSTLYDADVDVTEGSADDKSGMVDENDFGEVFGTSVGGLHWCDAPVGGLVAGNLLSNMLLDVNSTEGWYSSEPCCTLTSSGTVRVYGTFTSIEEFKAQYAGLQVCYKLATPTTISFTPRDVELLEGINVVTTNGEKVAVTYKAGILATLGDIDDLNDKVKTKFDKKDVAKVEGANASKPYAVGDYMLRSDGFYRVTASIANGAAITSNNTTKVTIGSELSNKVDTNDSRLSDARTPSNNSDLVHKTGNETITGTKTFSNDTTILNSGTNTGYIGLNLSSSGSSIALKKQSESDTIIPVNITANALSQYYGTSQTPYIIQLGTSGTSTDKVKISSAGSITINGNEVVTTNDSRLSNARTPSNNSDLVHISGTETITGTKTFSSSPKTTGLYVDWLQLKTNSANSYCIQFDSSITMGLSHDIHFINTDGNISMNIDNFSASNTYEVGSYTVYQGQLYKCTTRHFESAWDSSHFTRSINKIVSSNDIIAKNFESIGSDYAEKFETLEDCPACRFVTLDGEKIKLAQSEDDYILGITSELPSIIGDRMNQGTPVGLLGKLWVECDDTIKINSFVTSGKDGIATKSDKGYRVMAVDGNKCKVLVK